MALIPSARSFVAPFMYKRNLIAIILVALFFGIYRLSGGGIESRSRYGRYREYTPIKKEYNRRGYTAERKLSVSGKRALLDDLLREGRDSAKAPDSGGSASKLDEIERSLGLR
ncbi:MAG: hypothetical protein D6808_00205 [Candidatus Dadabacteria bacterium]|nr:MAG: hypothetical protein D6808_00205 [Candidatus Dadabacteria bacterium]